jgi:hypothetical protein
MRPFGPRGRTPLPTLRALAALFSRSAPTAPLILTCYGKAECSLCDKAKVPVARLVATSSGTIVAEWVDILTDPALQARWGERIPVICIGETVLAEGKVSELRLRRAIEALRQAGKGNDG